MSQTLLDTDVLIDHFRGHRRLRLSDPKFQISVVTRCELFAGRNADEPTLRRTLNMLKEVSVNRAIAETAGHIRRTTGIPVPDALIAATALEREMALMTRNRRHFERVSGLALRDPQDHAGPSVIREPPSQPVPPADVERQAD
jgi:predicted nucleic acid-binding protein